MTKLEFENLITYMQNNLIPQNGNYRGVCGLFRAALYSERIDIFTYMRMKRLFEKLFDDRINEYANVYWLGPLNEEGMHTRFMCLEVFKQHCIQHRLYRKGIMFNVKSIKREARSVV